MEKIIVDLKNCYGIRAFEAEFDFSNKSANIIYAPNGMMKTSFAKTFQDYSAGKETRDRIHTDRLPTRKIFDEVGTALDPASVFVIEPYSASYESARISTLLANRDLKREYDEIHKNIDIKKNDFLKLIRKVSGVKTGVEDAVSLVFRKQVDNFLPALDRIRKEVEEEDHTNLIDVPYASIFNVKVEKFLDTADFKDKLKEYATNYDELLSKSRFFRKGVFNHYQAGEIAKQLKNHGFFKAEHTIYLNSKDEEKKVTSETELEEVISEEMDQILSDEKLKKSFDAIDMKLKANQDLRSFREFLLENQNMTPLLSNPELLKENLWKSYFARHIDSFKSLMAEYDDGKKRIEEITKAAGKEATKWQDVINIFNRRFSVPFKVSIENKQDVILKSMTPNISFEFDDDSGTPVPVDRSKLVEVLSNGEKRALYILNIIFEVEARKEAKIPTLFVVDDIADSFDYKNKYAIVEYLHDILHEGDSKQIILTHNYDFYRTVWKRFELGGANFHITRNNGELHLQAEEMYRDPFQKWTKSVNGTDRSDMLIAMIPFVRNLTEYCGGEEDGKTLTSLLHIKPDTDEFTVGKLVKIFANCLKGADFSKLNDDKQPVKKLIYFEADKLSEAAEIGTGLHEKIVLSIGIRLKSEEFLIGKINDPEFVTGINKNQTAQLIRRFREQFSDEDDEIVNIHLMEKVNLMTPENIHLNSFMYEPILDMSTEHLSDLYKEVSAL